MGPSSRGRPIGRWKDRVKEYMCERDGVWVQAVEVGQLEDGGTG